MLTKRNRFSYIIIIGSFLLLFACTKNTTVYIDTTPEITTTVSFAKDMIPIFESKCAISGCHNAGGHVPVLTADKAYNNIIVGNYIDLGNPENSSLYLWLTGKKATPMPVGGPANPGNINALTLAWITQGGKNN